MTVAEVGAVLGPATGAVAAAAGWRTYRRATVKDETIGMSAAIRTAFEGQSHVIRDLRMALYEAKEECNELRRRIDDLERGTDHRPD